MPSNTDLTYGEFEILQLLLRYGDQPLPTIPRRLAITSQEVADAITSLAQQGLVRRTGDKLRLRGPTTVILDKLAPYKVQRAVILAAGLGSRMRPATNTLPKPMMLINNKRIIETQLDALLAANITDITIVRGYLGDMFDPLTTRYPNIKFITSTKWNLTSALDSAVLAIDLLDNAYLLEGDIYIHDPAVIRPYEYRSSYCGSVITTERDWHFTVPLGGQNRSVIQKLSYGNFTGNANPHSKTYKFIGIMFWASAEARQLKIDVARMQSQPTHHNGFIESVPFSTRANASDYTILARPIEPHAATEVDTYQELLELRFNDKDLSQTSY